jgi:glycerol dehydrogenase
VADRETRIPIAASGRYVRVQQAATEYLSLAEVEVWAAQETPAETLEPAPAGSSGPLQLTRVALPAGLSSGGLWQIIAGGPGYIAVGALGRINPKALSMTSVDGDSWQRSRLTGTAAAGELLDVAAFSGGYAAIGRAASGFRTVIWLSANGVDWEAIADARVFANTKPVAITERSGGLCAVGCSVHADGVCSQTLAWVSTDGRTWTRSTLTLGRGWQLNDVDSQGDRLLVVGSQQIPPFHAVAAVSDGSAKWRQYEGDRDGFFSQALLLDDGTAIAVGMGMASTAPQIGLLESSQDGGASWQPMDVGAPPGSGFRGISVADDTLIFGEQAQPDGTEGKAEMWQLDANSQLRRVAWEDEELPAASAIVGFTPFAGSRGGVAVGSVDTDPNSSGKPAVWLLEPMQAPASDRRSRRRSPICVSCRRRGIWRRAGAGAGWLLRSRAPISGRRHRPDLLRAGLQPGARRLRGTLCSMISTFCSPSRYTQGRDATAILGAELTALGLPGPVLIVAGRSARQALEATWARTLGDAGMVHAIHDFGGECTDAEIARVVSAAQAVGAATVVGAGGGKVLDTARGAADALGLHVVNCPTVASSDAPCSALSVVYTDEGAFQAYRFYRRNPDLVLVDTSVIARSPARLLVSGMGDALATWFEARTCVAGHVRNMRGGGSTRTALALAELCYRTLLADGLAARRSVEEGVVTPALERIVEANTLLSGLGFESSGLAAAHAIHNGLTTAPQAHAFFHGEKVAFGAIVQLVMEGTAQRELDEVLAFATSIGLPVSLAQLGCGELTREQLAAIGERATAPGETIHNEPFEVTPELVVDAIRAADAAGRAFLATAG